MSKNKIANSRDKWKEKAREKTKEANSLSKQKKRLEHSRAHWKQKCKQQCMLASSRPSSIGLKALCGQGIKCHVYNSVVVALCLFLKFHAQLSICSISKSISIWITVLELETKAPCHTTVHTWLRKAGYFRLHEPKAGSQKAQWVLFVDESVCVGKEKLLLIMAVDIREVLI